MPPQIVRLVLLTLGIVASYLALRAVLVPESFGEHGHYRGAALGEIADHEPVFAGAKACARCHDEVVEVQEAHEHRGISCEACHQPARAHAKDPDLKTVPFPADGCLRCHLKDPARPATQKQLDPRKHFEGRCGECHLPHHPKESP